MDSRVADHLRGRGLNFRRTTTTAFATNCSTSRGIRRSLLHPYVLIGWVVLICMVPMTTMTTPLFTTVKGSLVFEPRSLARGTVGRTINHSERENMEQAVAAAPPQPNDRRDTDEGGEPTVGSLTASSDDAKERGEHHQSHHDYHALSSSSSPFKSWKDIDGDTCEIRPYIEVKDRPRAKYPRLPAMSTCCCCLNPVPSWLRLSTDVLSRP